MSVSQCCHIPCSTVHIGKKDPPFSRCWSLAAAAACMPHMYLRAGKKQPASQPTNFSFILPKPPQFVRTSVPSFSLCNASFHFHTRWSVADRRRNFAPPPLLLLLLPPTIPAPMLASCYLLSPISTLPFHSKTPLNVTLWMKKKKILNAFSSLFLLQGCSLHRCVLQHHELGAGGHRPLPAGRRLLPLRVVDDRFGPRRLSSLYDVTGAAPDHRDRCDRGTNLICSLQLQRNHQRQHIIITTHHKPHNHQIARHRKETHHQKTRPHQKSFIHRQHNSSSRRLSEVGLKNPLLWRRRGIATMNLIASAAGSANNIGNSNILGRASNGGLVANSEAKTKCTNEQFKGASL